MRALLLAVALTACSTATVGVPCATQAECTPGQACVTTGAPGGFCTRGCTEPGATLGCPGGTICIYFGNSQAECSPYCTSNADCRVNYQCDLTGGLTASKACRPEGSY
jgi:hypothetical protein